MLVILAAIIIAILVGIAYFAGYFKKRPGEERGGENIPSAHRGTNVKE